VKKLPFIGESKGLPLATSTWGFREKIATSKVVFSGQVTMSQNVRKFESDFSDRIGSNWSIMVNSGSSANLLAAAAFRLRFSEEEFKFRNEVLVPTVSWSTTYFPWHQLGFKLKFVDVSFADFNIDPKKVLKAIDEKTVGICIVHLLGAPANLESLKKLASEHDLFLFEDACEAMGSKIQSQNVGTFGDMGSFSTYFSHHISTGEGGFVVTDDEKTAHQLISLRAHGWLRNLPQENFVSTKTGDSWLDQFRFYLPGYNLREKNALHYRESLKQIPWLSLQQPQFDSTWFAFGHIINPESGINRKLIVEKLKEIGVESRPVVTGSFVKNPVVKLLNCVNANEDFEIADLLEERGFMIGNHPYDIRKRLDKLVKNLSQLI
jgi:CDP-6-deoxy-D-xylo-4-hexulose-3-dehydrase